MTGQEEKDVQELQPPSTEARRHGERCGRLKLVGGSGVGADGRTGAVGQALAVLGLASLTTAAFARGAGRRGGVSAGAGARPDGRLALRDAGRRALPPVGPSRPEPVHWTNGVADRGPRARAGAKPPAVFRGGSVTGPDGQLEPLPTGGGAGPSRSPGPPPAVHCRTTHTVYSWLRAMGRTCGPPSHLDSWGVRCSLGAGARLQGTCCQVAWCQRRGRG